MSYQLSIILGTAISLRKFHRALFGLDICLIPLLFFSWWRPPFTSKGKAKSAGERKSKNAAECPGSVIDYFHARGSTSRRGGSLLCSNLSWMPVGHLHRRRCHYDSLEGAGKKKKKGWFLEETRKLRREKSYYRSYFNSIRLDAISSKNTSETLSELIVRFRISKFPAFR